MKPLPLCLKSFPLSLGARVFVCCAFSAVTLAAPGQTAQPKKSSPAPAAAPKPAAPKPAATPHPATNTGGAGHGATTVSTAHAGGPTANGAHSTGPTANGTHATGVMANGTHEAGGMANGSHAGPTTANRGMTTANGPRGMEGGMGSHNAPISRTATGRIAPTGSHTIQTRNGAAVTRRPDGRISDMHDARRGMDVHHGLDGGRRVSVMRADHSRIVAERGRRGFVERRYSYRGHDFARRSYYWHGREYNRYYRGYYYHGVMVNVYAPAVYYPPAFYGWAYNPWAVPVAYGWGWGGTPWYGFYGAYFVPYPVYAGPAFWLADYLIAEELQAAYAARAGLVTAVVAGGGIPVVPNQLWTDAGTPIVQGQSYTVSASGMLQFNGNGMLSPPSGRIGGPQVDADCAPGLFHNGFPAPQLPCLSLIAKIGPDGAPFEIGNTTTFVAPGSGELFLGVNDGNLSDNSGGWVAAVSSTGGQPQEAVVPSVAGGAVLTPEVKEQIVDEVKAQIALENAEAQQNTQGQDVDPASSSIARILGDGHSHVFVVGDGLDVTDANNAECALSEGDVLQFSGPPPADNATDVNMTVVAGKGTGKECQRADTVTVAVTDLQEMQNHLRETVDQGMQELRSKQGQGGLPAAPPSAQAATTQSAFTQAAPPPEQNGAADVNQQLAEGDKAEQEATQEAAAAPAQVVDVSAPVQPQQAATVNIALGQSINQVTSALGPPQAVIDLGSKKIYKYKDMKITFKDGKVSDVE